MAERGVIDYDLIHKIENKYESLMDCPEDDKDLQEVRSKLNVKVSAEYREELWDRVKNNK